MERVCKVRKSIRCIIYIIISLCILSIGNVYASNIEDIQEHWSKEYVEYLVEKGAINGYPDRTFRPENTVTYAEAIKLIVASYNKGIENGKGHWASNYVEYAKETGIVATNMKVEEKLDKAITRKEVIYMVYESLIEYAKKPVINNDRNEKELPFKDVEVGINKYGIDYVKPIRESYYLGIIIGNDMGLMNPDTAITRGEIVTILTRAYAEEYRKYPMNDVTNFYPSNANEYNRILGYMPNSFYEAGSETFAKYVQYGTPFYYINPYRYDEPNKAFNYIRVKSERLINELLNISYTMSELEWQIWKEKISVLKEFSEKEIEEYIQYIKNNKIEIKGGAIMNPCTIGEFYISRSKSSLGIKGIVNYEITSNPNNKQYITIAEYITNEKGVIEVEGAKYIIMHFEETKVEDPELILYNLKYITSTIEYI